MQILKMQPLTLVLVLCAASLARAQKADPRPVNPLATKQQMIEDRLSRLEDRMFRLREKLAETEPQNAELLAAALEQAGVLDVKGRTAAIVKLLEKANQLDASMEEQEALIADLESLLNTLLNRDPNDEQRKAELERLEQIKRDLDEIAREQLRQRHRAADAVRAQRAAQQLDAALKQIDSMLEQQGRLSEETRKGEGESSEAKKKQSDLAEQAKRLAEEIKRLAEQSAPSEQSQSEQQQSQGQQSQGEQSPQQQSQKQDSQQQGSEAQKSDSKSSEQSSESKSQSPSDDMKQASKDLDKSGEHMDKAAEQLEKSDAEQAAKQQVEAEEELRRARHRLEEAKKELEKQADAERKESEQRQLAQRTDDLSQKMKGQQDGSQQGQQQGEQQQGGQQQQGGEQQQGEKQSGDQQQQQQQQQDPAPGQQNVERAQQQMDKAADDLKESKDEDAIEKQDQALAELEQAQRELEDALRQLRQEEQEEILRNLNSRLSDMVAKQSAINRETSQLATTIDGDPNRADQLKAADLASRQEELARDAESAVRLLEEDGTTVVFLNVFRQISSDMYHVAGELAQVNAGAITQSTQAGILETLQELLDAVKKLQEQQQGGQGGMMAGGGAGEAPLVPTSAELRMLKTSQLRVNQQTDVAAEALQKGDADQAEVAGALRRASARQAQLKEMARELQERAEKGR